MEQWKDIPGYEGIYQASNTGHIRSVEGKTTYSKRHGEVHWKSRVLKEKWHTRCRCSSGHKDSRVVLYKEGQNKTYLVARLVAMTWVDGYENSKTVNHIDGDPSNNNIENLEWVSKAENIRKGFETGCYSSMARKTTLIDPSGIRHEFYSMSEACKYLGKNTGYLHNQTKKSREVRDANGVTYEVVF